VSRRPSAIKPSAASHQRSAIGHQQRFRTGSVVVTTSRGPDQWLATFADPVRTQSAIDRFTSNAYDLVIEGEAYRPRLKPRLTKDGKERAR
jgi:hypothetical protein